MNLEDIKAKLRSYKREEITFYEPHFTHQLLARGGSKEEFIKEILKAGSLFYYEKVIGKYGDNVFVLYFKVSNTRMFIVPVIFDKNNRKNLYIMTYILRHRLFNGGRNG